MKVGSAVLVLALCACARNDQVVLKVHHFVPPTSTIHTRMIAPWCEKLAEDSAGAMKCQIYPAMQLGGTAAQLYDQVRDGVVDVAFAVPGFTAGRFPGVEVFELPFMMRDAEATSRALWDFVAQSGLGEFAEVRPLAFNVHGPGLFHLVARPLNDRSDLRGLKIRAPTRQSSKLIAALGGTPVGMPLPQIPEALSKGVIDGVVVPWEIVPAMKIHELTRYHTETPSSEPAIYTTVFIFAMNKARYQELSAVQRKVIDDNSGVELSGRFGRIMAAADVEGRASVPASSIRTLPSAELQQWKRLTQPVIDQWVHEIDARGAHGRALLASARSLIEKHQ